MGKRRNARNSSRSQSPSSSVTTENNTTYDVECILAVRPIPRSKVPRFEYLVKWYGYPGEDTWETYEYLDPGCDRLLTSLWHELGCFYKHSQKRLYPSQEWIDAEIAYFHKQMTKRELAPHGQRMFGYNEETGRMNVYD